MTSPIPYGRQHITDDDIQAVVEVLKSDYLTQGPQIGLFETAFAEYIGSKYAVAVANGTAALHLSALVLGIKPGDKVITSPITFAATANCVLYCGGDVVFADIDPETYLLDAVKVKTLLEMAPKGTFQGIIPVDFTGRALDLQRFRALADEHDLWIIEDACHAPGGYFVDSSAIEQKCGNGKYADLAIFSFHPVKHIALGEGGMITTNDEKLYKKLQLLRSHGITKDLKQLSENHGGWYYEMQLLGYNYRLTDFQAALGISQLKRADDGLSKRRAIAARYNEAFQNNRKVLHHTGIQQGHAYHLYIIQVADRAGLYEYLRKHNIYSQVHYIPVHQLPYYQTLGWKKGDFPLAESYYEKCLSLPIYATLTNEQQEFVIKKIIKFLT